MERPLLSLLVVTAAETFAAVKFFPEVLTSYPLSIVALAILSFNVIFAAAIYVFVYPSFLSPLRHIPSPGRGNPFIGRSKSIYQRPPGTDFLNWTKNIPNDGFIRFNGLMGREFILITEPKALSEVLVTQSYSYEKPAGGRDFLRKFLGDGLVVVEGDPHRFQRKHVMPSFSFRRIKELYPMMWEKAVTFTSRIESEMHGRKTDTLDLGQWSMKVTMDAIGVAGLGREFNTMYNSEDELVSIFTEVVQPSREKILYMAMVSTFGTDILDKLPWKVSKRMTEMGDNLRRICRQLVADKKHAMTVQKEGHVDVLSSLIDSNDFSDDELVDQMLTFLAAGHETTSSSLEWACYLLAKHPDMQKRLREELRLVNLNFDTVDPTTPDLASTLESLPLLNGVINETLRLFPTVPLTIRQSNKDTTIMGQRFPKGIRFILSIWATNRSPQIWGNDSEQFKPERWIDAEKDKPNNHGGADSNYSLLTFLHGPRSCIGQGFAKAELRCLVAAWVSSFEFSMKDPNEIVEASGSVTIKPKNGLNLNITRLREE